MYHNGVHWWRQGSPRQGVIVPRQGAEVSAGSTLPCKHTPGPYFVALWGRGIINKLHAHKQELTRGVLYTGGAAASDQEFAHLAPPFPIFPPLTSRAP